MSTTGSIRGAAAAQLGFDYQLDVSILAAFQLMLISKAAEKISLEPANEEDLEADIKPGVPGRIQPSAKIAGAYKLVVQIKLCTGEPWSIEEFKTLLRHGSDNPGGRPKALKLLEDPDTRYLLVTNADVKGVTRRLLVGGFEESADHSKFPKTLGDILKHSPEGRVAIWGGLTQKQLASDLRELMSDLLHVPRANQDPLLDKLRSEARRRTRGRTPGVWSRDDLLNIVRAHGGFLASHAGLEYFVPPTNFPQMIEQLKSTGAVVICGPSGTGKTQAALKLCDIARQWPGGMEVVALGAESTPITVRKLVDRGPMLFYIEDPWGQYRVRDGADSWTEQLPRLLANATKDHIFIVTSRVDMLSSDAQDSLKRWSVELDARHYGDAQLREIYDIRMDQLVPGLQSMALAFRKGALRKLRTPFEVDLYFQQLAQGPEFEEEDHAFYGRLIASAHRDAVAGVVVKALESMDTSGVSAIVWALLSGGGQLDRSQVIPLQRALRTYNRGLCEGLDKLIDRMVDARHLRQPTRTISFSHPSVREGFELFLSRNWIRSEAAFQLTIQALTNMPAVHKEWGIETAAHVFKAVRKLIAQIDIAETFDIDPVSQAAIDGWLDAGLVDPASNFLPLLEIASDVGSPASIPSQVARWLLKGVQRGVEIFDRWEPPVYDDDWYARVSADPRSSLVASRFVREHLGGERGRYGHDFAERLDRIAPNICEAFLHATRTLIGGGYESNMTAIAKGAVRDLTQYAQVVDAALDDLADARRGYDQTYAEISRAIEDGEEDAAAEEAHQWGNDDLGYCSNTIVEIYVRTLRSKGEWLAVAEHPRVSELLNTWAYEISCRPDHPSQAEVEAILFAAKGLDTEPAAWGAINGHWSPAFEPRLAERLADDTISAELRRVLTTTALEQSPMRLVEAIESRSARPVQQLQLLAALDAAINQVDLLDRAAVRDEVTDHLPAELREIIAAFNTDSNSPGRVGPKALKILTDTVQDLDIEALNRVVPVIVASGADASVAVHCWLTAARSKPDAIAACEMAIAVGDNAAIELALGHQRADARQLALRHIAKSLNGPLPAKLLAMSTDPSSRVRDALVLIIKEKPHPEYVEVLRSLIYDQWSSADWHSSATSEFAIARSAVIALISHAPWEGLAIGDELLELAGTTNDRTLRQLALAVAVHSSTPGLQLKLFSMVSLTAPRSMHFDALAALADAAELDEAIATALTPSFLTEIAPALSAHAAHLVGAHAPLDVALALFTSVASVNSRQVLLLVGANAMANRDREYAGRILDLLEPGHPARQLLDAPDGLRLSALDDLGSVTVRKYARGRLGSRIIEG